MTGPGFGFELFIQPMLGVEHDLALFGREGDFASLVAVADGPGQFGAIFSDQAANKPTDAQAQVVIT
ncbi:hypothetical protein D3C85_1826800 [compost metagenome]